MEPQSVTIDFTKAQKAIPRRRRRSKRDISRFWNTRYNAFIRAGFNEETATKAASDGLPLKSRKVQQLLLIRKLHIEVYMEEGNSYEKAKELCDQDLSTKLEAAGETEWNPWYEVSP